VTKILAHRGASHERPENTMLAFRRAAEVHADGLEMDVHLLPDGTLIVRHDAVLGRCEEKEGSIYGYTGDKLKQICVCGDKKAYSEAVMPEFEELLSWLDTNDLFLNCEIKSNGFTRGIEDRVVAAVKAHGLTDRVIFSSFDHYLLDALKQKYPEMAVGTLYGSCFGMDMAAYCAAHHFNAIHPHFADVTAEQVAKCHANGIAVNVWTVDEPADLRRMFDLGVDAVISNDPAKAIAVYAAWQKEQH